MSQKVKTVKQRIKIVTEQIIELREYELNLKYQMPKKHKEFIKWVENLHK